MNTLQTHPAWDIENTQILPPQISADGTYATFKWKSYRLTRLSKAETLIVSWTTEEHFNKGLMRIDIDNDHIEFTSSIPEKYLPYCIIQEVECPDMTESWKAVPSIIEELKYVPDNIRQEYLIWRLSFFENVHSFWVNYRRIHGEAVEQEWYKNYIQSINHIIAYLRTPPYLEKVNQIMNGTNNELPS